VSDSVGPRLELSGVRSNRGGLEVLHGVSLQVRDELLAVFGLNGSGKSTLLRTIAGLTPVTAGSIRLDGFEIAGHPAHDVARNGLAFMPQNNQIFGSLTVYENLRLAGYLLPARDVRLAIDREIARFPRLVDRRDVQAQFLSGGERQMLALAKALMPGPKMLLLDEPSAGLAPVVIGAVHEVLCQVREAGFPILMVEQNVKRALEIADRAVVMYLGAVRDIVEVRGNVNALAEVRELMLGRGAGRRQS
jgi:branched-chain amino acid transport system ATP-binding protein